MNEGMNVAWVSRHPPTVEQASALALAGYRRWVKIAPPTPGRVVSGEDAYRRAVRALKGKEPDLFVVKLPPRLLSQLAQIVGGRIPIVEAVTTRKGQWIGKWREVVEMKVAYRNWTPSEGVGYER